MATKPTTLPDWATGASRTSTPSAGERTSGFQEGYSPAAKKTNWLFNLIYQWIQFFAAPTGHTADPLIELANDGGGPCLKGTSTHTGVPGGYGGPVFEGHGNPGLYGEAETATGNSYGVHGKGNAGAPTESAGVFGESSGHEAAVWGDGTSGGLGIRAVGKSTPGSGDRASAHIGPQSSLPTYAEKGDLTVVSDKLYLCTVASTSSPTWVVVGTQT